MPQGWVSGSCGKRGEGEKSVGRDNKLSARVLFLFFLLCLLYGVLLPPSLAHSAPWREMDLICCS